MDIFSCRACGRKDHGCQMSGLKIVSLNIGWRMCNVVWGTDTIFPGTRSFAFLCSDICQARYEALYTLEGIQYY
jgi:hypothetical protein